MSPPLSPGGPGPLEHLRVPLKLLDPYVLPEARAALEAREAAIAGLLNRISSGTSKIVVAWGWNDPRPRPLTVTWDAATERRYQESLRKQALRYFEDLARTEAGFRVLSDLDASPHRTVVVPWGGERNETLLGSKHDFQQAYVQRDGTPGRGVEAEVRLNGSLTTHARPGEKEEPWMTERVRYGLYHELIHAWHGTRGTVARGLRNGTPNAEWQAIGLGPYESEPVTENKIRQQLGKDPRPRA